MFNWETLACMLVYATVVGLRCSAGPLIAAMLAFTSGHILAGGAQSWRLIALACVALVLLEVIGDKFVGFARVRDAFAAVLTPLFAGALLFANAPAGSAITGLGVALALLCALLGWSVSVGNVLIRAWNFGFASAHPIASQIIISLFNDALAIALFALCYMQPWAGLVLSIIVWACCWQALQRFVRIKMRIWKWLFMRMRGHMVADPEDLCR